MEGPHLPCLCSSSPLPQTWGPAALDPWASLLSASPILAGPPRGDLREGGYKEARPVVAGGSGCGWKLCHKDLGAVQRCSQSPGEKERGSELPRTMGNRPPLPVFLFHIPDPTLEPGKERGGGWRGSWLQPQDTPRKLVCLCACQRVNLPLGPCLSQASPLSAPFLSGCNVPLSPFPGPQASPLRVGKALSSSLDCLLYPSSSPTLETASVSSFCSPAPMSPSLGDLVLREYRLSPALPLVRWWDQACREANGALIPTGRSAFPPAFSFPGQKP